MTRIFPWLLLGLASATAGFSTLLLINAGAALDDSRSQTDYLRERSELTLSIIRIDWVGRDERSLMELARTMEKRAAVIGREENAIRIGDLLFEINSGAVVEVRFFD